MAKRVTSSISFKDERQAARLDYLLEEMSLNRSEALRGIADGTYTLFPFSEVEQNLLVRAAISLFENQDQQAGPFVDKLLQLPFRGPLKAELHRLKASGLPWVSQVEEFISQRQPFYVVYHGTRRLIQYAEAAQRDDRRYLHAWCAEPNPRAEIPELAHNRLFWLGEDAQVEPAVGVSWRAEGLDYLRATFRVSFKYRPKAEDEFVEDISIQGQPWTLVTQRVTNVVWFTQRIARYGNSCVVESPESIVSLWVSQLESIIENYRHEKRSTATG
ncbi:MAG TPA: hypothetical protein V6D29_04770 [Leptolyngbyaceae cyanobacterium]